MSRFPAGWPSCGFGPLDSYRATPQALARFIASEKFAQHAAQGIDTLNTDDRQVIEFSFARSLGREQDIINQIRLTAQRIGADKPTMLRGAVAGGLYSYDNFRRFSLPMKDSPAARYIRGGTANR